MPLPLDMLQCAVRITSCGDLLGTGFLAVVQSEGNPVGRPHRYVVTANHVIHNQVEIAVDIPNPFGNGVLYSSIRVDGWRQPLQDVDLALAPLPDRQDRNYQACAVESFLPLPDLPVPDLGAQIYYVGIFQPVNRPVARAGTIGALDQVGIRNDYGSPVHLVDCRSYDGFSGSPCFVKITFARLDDDEIPAWLPQSAAAGLGRLGHLQYCTLLCGMFISHWSDENSSDAAGVVSRYGMGVMLPSGEIRKGLMTEQARDERRKWDREREVAKSRSTPPLVDASSKSGDGDDDDFSRFEKLTRKLVNVPKKEIDAKRKAP